MRYSRSAHLFLLFSLTVSAAGVSRPAARTYATHDYYVLEHDAASSITVQELANHLDAELVEAAGELSNHWLLRAPKAAELDGQDQVLDAYSNLQRSHKRDSVALAVKHISRQSPRQRMKRAALPAEEESSGSLARDVAERLGIADPLFPEQWHLVNEDYPEHMVNAAPVWDMGITGEGVISCMVDDGLDYESDDLADNFVSVTI